ncbi:RtcB family protein [Haloterrigena alkaliphila]|uniref:tRNA-splicing ligase RtcB n=1 Tax=Haloterrigena alkaliphila TaxID=2816475 RepID=A0A8A2VFB1_9EURY|nr:RtcB family protein [Haloterrigena alkaliphila]QSW99357.1 RtcB family protein [Haloterrigena alkaliphila]
MTTFDADGITLERVREYVWEIPQEGDMRVPARVLASEALLEQITEDKTLEQLTNTTHLPGITNYAICMPDGHQGYGFPVGGVGALDAENGCISPGAVGYDINCLTGETEVLLEHGRRLPIENLEDRFEEENAMVASDRLTPSEIRLFTERENATVYEVGTETGDRISATADHPFRTPDGMLPLEELTEGDEVLLQPFRGVPDEEPEEFTVLSQDDFADENPQLIRALEERDLLPLKSTDDAFNRFLKLVGFHTGDGAIGAGGQTWFYGDPEDLESIQDDIEAVGFTPSKIYERDRSHDIDGKTFETTEYSARSTSKAFQKALLALGAPDGRKIESDFTTPWYFDRLTNWQKALYVSAYFGAEMNAPAAQHDKNLYCPKVSQTRITDVADAGEEFMADLASFLADLGIETNEIERFETDSSTDRETIRLRLGIKNDSANLVQFFSTVGYRYNQEKRRKSIKALQYLKRKEAVIDRRVEIATEAKAMADGGTTAADIKSEFDINERFIERSIWSERTGRPRPPADFPGFEEYCEPVSVGDDLTIPAQVRSIEPAGERTVYDIGVTHDAHNFVGNGFVVSNCGVRMMRTNLTYDELQGREEELVDSLFANVPSGLGGGGIVEAGVDTVEEILERGVDWALEHGHAVEEDLLHCEDEGMREGADASKVSQKAKDRGKNQIGSLGSGNHFLEVQRVTDVFDGDVGEAYGLEEDQIVVLIHCGSRGLGHQTCNDYLRKIEQQHQGLLDQLPDKELAAAPSGSQLAEDYYGAMNAAINFAWVNRQLIMHRTRQVFERVFDRSWEEMDMHLLYDVAHNIAKKETHAVGDGDERELYVHRKGATRAFPAGHPEVPKAYRDVGQPVIIPGSMGTGSYVLRGGENSMDLTFGSTAHGAGRLMSRTQAKDEFWGGDVQQELEEQDRIYVKAQSGSTVAEEAPGVYKDVDEVVRVSDELGIGDKVARTFPVCNIKG